MSNETNSGMAEAIISVGMNQEDQVLEQYLDMLKSSYEPVPHDPDYVLRVACCELRNQKKRIDRQIDESPYLDELRARLANAKAKIGALVGTEKLEKILEEEK